MVEVFVGTRPPLLLSVEILDWTGQQLNDTTTYDAGEGGYLVSHWFSGAGDVSIVVDYGLVNDYEDWFSLGSTTHGARLPSAGPRGGHRAGFRRGTARATTTLQSAPLIFFPFFRSPSLN
ncbi:MAG: hypothetical protein Kow0069_21240 [Promethearchaeota archaeon]